MKQVITNFWLKKQGKVLELVLTFIMVLFIAIMIGVYIIAKQANPIFLDEKGKPIGTQSDTRSY